MLWCAGLHWENSRVCCAAQHIASCSYCTLSVHSTHAMSEHIETVPEHIATPGSSLTHNSLGCHPVCCWLVSHVWCYAAQQRSWMLQRCFTTPFDGDWSSHSRNPSHIMQNRACYVYSCHVYTHCYPLRPHMVLRLSSSSTLSGTLSGIVLLLPRFLAK